MKRGMIKKTEGAHVLLQPPAIRLDHKGIEVRPTVYEEGAPTFVFNVEGLDWQ